MLQADTTAIGRWLSGGPNDRPLGIVWPAQDRLLEHCGGTFAEHFTRDRLKKQVDDPEFVM